MSFNMTLIGQMVFFGVFVWFCMKYVWPPIMSALDERQKKISDGLAAAERGMQEQELAQKKVGQQLSEAKAQAAEIINKAEKRGSEIVGEAKEVAKSEGVRIVASAQSEIDKQVFQAKEELRGQVADLAVDGAEKILSREIDKNAHADMLNQLAAKL